MAQYKAFRLNVSDTSASWINIAEINFAGTGSGSYFANSSQSGFGPGEAFDNSASTAWSSVTPFNGPWQIGKLLSALDDPPAFYQVRAAPSGWDLNTSPRNWTLEGSTDTTTGLDGTWTALHTVTGEVGWSGGEQRTFTPTYPIEGDLSAIEPDIDVFAGSSPVPASGSLLVTESSNDEFLALAPTGIKKAWRIKVLANNGDLTQTRVGNIVFLEKGTRINVSNSDTPGTYHDDAFDSESVFNGGVYHQEDGTLPIYIGKIFTNAVEIEGYSLNNPHNAISAIKDWDLECSDDTTDIINGTWQLADKRRGESNWGYLEQRFYPPELFITEGDLIAKEEDTDLFITPYFIFLKNEVLVDRKIFCTFMGDALENVTIPISNLTESVRESGLSSANIFIPNGKKYANQLSKFSQFNGTFFLTYTDTFLSGNKVNTQSQTYKIDSIGSGHLANNWGVNINGVAKFVFVPNINIIQMDKVILLQRNYQGRAAIKAALDSRIIPGDRVGIEQKNYQVHEVKITNIHDNQYMELVVTEV